MELYDLLIYDENDFAYRSEQYNASGDLKYYFLYYKSKDVLQQIEERYSPEDILGGKSIRVEDTAGNWLYSATQDAEGNEVGRYVTKYNENGAYQGWDSYKDGNLTVYVREENGKNRLL